MGRTGGDNSREGEGAAREGAVSWWEARLMGLTYTTVRMRPLAGSKKEIEESFLVDTGAIDCFVSAAKLKRVGIKPEGKDVCELADGSTMELPYGFARVTFMGSETVTKVTFGPRDAESILGVAALESTGIGIDPVTRTLKRMAAKPLKRR
jgi:clan AA aspartic protease